MANPIAIPLIFTDSTVTAGTNPAKTGLTPTVLGGCLLAAPATAVSVNPTITAGGPGATGIEGIYVAVYDAETNGEATFCIDGGSALTVNADRFIYVTYTRDSGRILGAINSSNKVVETLLVDTLTTYTGNTPQTGDSFPKASAVYNAVANSQINGTITGASQISLTVQSLTVAGNAFTPPVGNLAGLQCTVLDGATGAEKARLTILGDSGTTTRTLTFASPGFPVAPVTSPTADTVAIS